MPQPGTQLNGKLSRRGRQSEGRPTKRTPDMVERIAKAISLGSNDEETAVLVGIERNTLINWKKDPEFWGNHVPIHNDGDRAGPLPESPCGPDQARLSGTV